MNSGKLGIVNGSVLIGIFSGVLGVPTSRTLFPRSVWVGKSAARAGDRFWQGPKPWEDRTELMWIEKLVLLSGVADMRLV